MRALSGLISRRGPGASLAEERRRKNGRWLCHCMLHPRPFPPCPPAASPLVEAKAFSAGSRRKGWIVGLQVLPKPRPSQALLLCMTPASDSPHPHTPQPHRQGITSNAPRHQSRRALYLTAATAAAEWRTRTAVNSNLQATGRQGMEARRPPLNAKAPAPATPVVLRGSSTTQTRYL